MTPVQWFCYLVATGLAIFVWTLLAVPVVLLYLWLRGWLQELAKNAGER